MEKICVAVRVRPPTTEEASNATHWKVENNSISLQNVLGTISGLSYAFDHVFDQNCRNERVYELLTKGMIQAVVEGFNGTAFAYGQTSSGKTFTMNGSENDPGIIYLAVNDIFRNIQMMDNREFLIRVSYMEIYNEEINDLLAPENGRLQIHECLERGIYVAGLREEIVNGAEQVLRLIERGEVNRHVGKTNMNVRSSRSHTIFRMVIESRRKDVPSGDVLNTDAIRVSVLNLVDLAGSERIAKTGAGGVRLKEGKHINKSLMVLGNVINKLSDGGKQRGHIPYRDSKLTRILQPALGGNAKTSIICTVAPEEVHIEETRGTLQFASRAKRITNCVQLNEILTDSALLKRQKLEIEELRKKLQGSHSEILEQEILKLRNAMLKYQVEREKLAMELEEERKSHKESDRCIREQQMKIDNLNILVNYSDPDRNSAQLTSCEGSFPHRISLDSFDQGRVSISQNYKEEHSDSYCISQGEAYKTPCLKSISNDFVTRRSNYSRLIDSSPISNNFVNISEDDSWLRLNKGHTTDLDSLLMTPDRNYQSFPSDNMSSGKPIDYYQEEAHNLKKQLDLANQEKEELERIHKKQLFLSNQLRTEISELQQESLLIRGIAQRMCESVATCKDTYKEILANMQSFTADENSLNAKLLSSISDIGISLFSTLEAHFSQAMDGHEMYSRESSVVQEQQKVLAEKLKDTVTTLVSSQDTNARDKCTMDFEGMASREEADVTWKEELINELNASKERYHSLERECNLNDQFLQVSKERCNSLERECNLLKEEQASLFQELSKSAQNLALFTAQNEKILKDLNMELQRRKDLEEEIRRFGSTFDRRQGLLASFHREFKDKIEKLSASSSVPYPKFMGIENKLLHRYPIENK